MPYEVIPTKFDRPSGKATISQKSGGGLRVALQEKTKSGGVETNYYDILPEDIPDYVNAERLNLGAEYHVILDSDGVRIVSIVPMTGTYRVKFLKFGHRKDEPPSPSEVDDNFNKGQKRLVFSAVYEITRGKYKGWQLRQSFIPYAFFPGTRSEEGTRTQITGKEWRRLDEWLRKNGFDPATDDLPWFSDNVLPDLETLVQLKAKTLSAVVEKGYIKNLTEPEDDED